MRAFVWLFILVCQFALDGQSMAHAQSFVPEQWDKVVSWVKASDPTTTFVTAELAKDLGWGLELSRRTLQLGIRMMVWTTDLLLCRAAGKLLRPYISQELKTRNLVQCIGYLIMAADLRRNVFISMPVGSPSSCQCGNTLPS
ncbi:MAG: hypothetical protein ACLPKB_18090 [Xanthobacteraceae bacterium]